MKILVIGNGAREHAIIWKLSQSKRVSKIYWAQGNGGIGNLAECVNIKVDDSDMLLAFALKEGIDLTIVGPEGPLVDGIVDLFEVNHLKIFGPNKRAANLEGSKEFAKTFMGKYGIPTPRYRAFEDTEEAIKGLDSFALPVVIKADGLAAGKGVFISETREDAVGIISSILDRGKFGEAGGRIILEAYVEGIEASLLCLVDGDNIIPLESAKDYKQIYDGDQGPNTGGMGCISPNPLFDSNLFEQVRKEILDRMMVGLKEEGIIYKGILFIGLMVTSEGPKVLEFNVRFGDPEAEVILPRLKNDLTDVFLKVLEGGLKEEDLEWTKNTCITVVAASGGYPITYEKGKEIKGLDDIAEDVMVFHSGTKRDGDGLVTQSGRVLAVTVLGDTLEQVKDKAYNEINKITFDKMHFRKDIGAI